MVVFGEVYGELYGELFRQDFRVCSTQSKTGFGETFPIVFPTHPTNPPPNNPTTTHPMECWPIATIHFKPPSVALVARLGFKVIDRGFSGQLAGLGANPFAQPFDPTTNLGLTVCPFFEVSPTNKNARHISTRAFVFQDHVPETDFGNIHHRPPYPSPRSSVNRLAGGVSDSLS